MINQYLSDADGNFVSAADVWNEKLEELLIASIQIVHLGLARIKKKQKPRKNKNLNIRITGFIIYDTIRISRLDCERSTVLIVCIVTVVISKSVV